MPRRPNSGLATTTVVSKRLDLRMLSLRKGQPAARMPRRPTLGLAATSVVSKHLDLRVLSLRKGHANPFCIVPILADDPEGNAQLTRE